MSFEVAPTDETMVSVPARVLQELLDATRNLETRVGALETALALGEIGMAEKPETGADLSPLQLARYAAALVNPHVQLYSVAGYEAMQIPSEHVEAITAKSALLAATRHVIQPYQYAFASALGTRAEAVRRLPAPPPKNAQPELVNGGYVPAQDVYNKKHSKSLSWQEGLPTGPYDTATYKVHYLPAQTKVKDSSPEMLSFSVKQPAATQPPRRVQSRTATVNVHVQGQPAC